MRGHLCSYAGWTYGAIWLVKSYFVPYLIVNMWLVLITDLQHTGEHEEDLLE